MAVNARGLLQERRSPTATAWSPSTARDFTDHPLAAIDAFDRLHAGSDKFCTWQYAGAPSAAAASIVGAAKDPRATRLRESKGTRAS